VGKYTVAEGRFVAYYRVSTAKQGNSGLGLEAQRAAVADFLDGGNWTLLSEHAEVESGKYSDRPALAEAMQACKLMGATLVIAKLDRLSRDAHFLLGLEKAGVDFVAVDMPKANRLTVRLMAVIAQEEREMISARTKAALAAAKARGVKLGGRRPNQHKLDPILGTATLVRASDEFAARVAPIAIELRRAGMSLRQIVAELDKRGIRTMRGGAWTAASARNVLRRHERISTSHTPVFEHQAGAPVPRKSGGG
jgi:DNA invertase Pin-like site-specific DNA recombinase